MTLVYGAVALLKCHNKATENKIVLLVPNLNIFTRDHLQTSCKMGVGWCKLIYTKMQKVFWAPLSDLKIFQSPSLFLFPFFLFFFFCANYVSLNVKCHTNRKQCKLKFHIKKRRKKVFLKAPFFYKCLWIVSSFSQHSWVKSSWGTDWLIWF